MEKNIKPCILANLTQATNLFCEIYKPILEKHDLTIGEYIGLHESEANRDYSIDYAYMLEAKELMKDGCITKKAIGLIEKVEEDLESYLSNNESVKNIDNFDIANLLLKRLCKISI